VQGGTPTRLTTQWQNEAKAFNERPLQDCDEVYVWADGIHLKVRLTQDKVCLLVIIGVRPDGRKELVALADGHRESTESWADLLRSAKRRGMEPYEPDRMKMSRTTRIPKESEAPGSSRTRRALSRLRRAVQ